MNDDGAFVSVTFAPDFAVHTIMPFWNFCRVSEPERYSLLVG
ncbi:hypothetical protein [Brevibacterium aurantiacum]|nr:hypothetical protein [Brevibacterium aurantiacum]